MSTQPKTSVRNKKLNKFVSPWVYKGITTMKKTNLIAAVLFGALFSIMPNAKAASYYWDTLAGAGNGVGSNTGVSGGVNAWSGTGSTWSTVPAGSATLTAGTWSSSGVMGINDTAIFQVDQGTSGSGNIAGTVTVSGTSSFAINVNTTGFTFKNISTSANNYLGATNGMTLGSGVNVNLSSMPVTSSGSGSLGLRMSGISGAADSSITIVGDTGSTAPVAGTGGSGVRILTDKSSAVGASVTNVISVNTIIATTGSQAAYFGVNSGTSLRLEGTVTINNGSKLNLSPGSSTSRLIEVKGNIMSYTAGALSIGEAANTGTVLLSGNNTLTGDLNVYGVLGYGSKTALGTSRVVLNQGATLAQSQTIGDGSDSARNIANNILLNGTAWAANTYVTLGGLGSANVFDGGIDMNGVGRLVRIDNATTINGGFSNSGGGGLTLTNNSTAAGGRTLNLNAASTYTGGTTLKGATASGTGWKVTTGNTSGSAFGTGNVNFDGTGATARGLLTGTGIITGTVGGYVLATAGSASSLGGGLLTVGQLDTATTSALSTMTFAFEATSTSLFTGSAYNNDVIRATATAGSPFTQALTSANLTSIYLNAGSLAGYDNGNAGVFQTGFFSGSNFSLGSGTFNLFVQAAGGTTTYNAATYQTWAEYTAGAGAGLNQTYNINTTAATLASGDAGFISTVTIIPEPSTGAMLMFGLVGLVGMRALRRKA